MRMREIMTIVEDVQLGRVIAAAIRAKSQLSYEALSAIEEWQACNWNIGDLELSYKGQGNPEIRQSVDAAFAPVRDLLRAQYGNTVPLYRGQRSYAEDRLNKGRVLFSWAGDERVAQEFGPGRLAKVIADADILKAVASYERTGFAKLGSYRFLRRRDNPRYFDIYLGREYQTDGSNLEHFLRGEQQHQRDYNDHRAEIGSVVGYRVPVDAIVWITNDLNSKEFICRWNPLAVSEENARAKVEA